MEHNKRDDVDVTTPTLYIHSTPINYSIENVLSTSVDTKFVCVE